MIENKRNDDLDFNKNNISNSLNEVNFNALIKMISDGKLLICNIPTTRMINITSDKNKLDKFESAIRSQIKKVINKDNANRDEIIFAASSIDEVNRFNSFLSSFNYDNYFIMHTIDYNSIKNKITYLQIKLISRDFSLELERINRPEIISYLENKFNDFYNSSIKLKLKYNASYKKELIKLFNLNFIDRIKLNKLFIKIK